MSKYFIYSLILFTLFIPLSEAKGNDIFYGHNSLNPLSDKETFIIPLPGGNKSLVNDNNITYLTNDHLGSTRLALNTDNTVQETVAYTPFGKQSSAGEMASSRSYTGMDFESETDTYDYHARWYDPSVGRFLSLDLQREDASPYIYVGNNPIVFTDPNGQDRRKVTAPMFFEEANIKLPNRKLTSAIKTELRGYLHQRPTLLSSFEETVVKEGEGVGTTIDSLVSRKSVEILTGRSQTIERVPNNRAYIFVGEGDYDVKSPNKLIEGMRKLSLVNKGTLKSPHYFAREIVILDFSNQGRSAGLLSSLQKVTDGQLVSLIRLKARFGGKGKKQGINRIAFEGNPWIKYEEGMLNSYVDTKVAEAKREVEVIQGSGRALGKIQSGELTIGARLAGSHGTYLVYPQPTGVVPTHGTPSEHLLYPTHFTTAPFDGRARVKSW